ncbi:general transcription factor 3C polypeptide 2 [Trichonephila inaurata madagascariensis]|uniref:General transcription factor 3C polypeptide 2 n=1 Tax=Trichonephila inaurata madagascariensis TaxID=2747483 RepID=A0A8X6X1P8_9ARAC|nr:general transcription factor 3C polypeptide 2 [Trichonephila inaurata madagascariensis]
METEKLNHKSTPSNKSKPDLTNELIVDSNRKHNTKEILESICNDFENIDVRPPKGKTYTTLKGLKVPSGLNSNNGSGITNEPVARKSKHIFEDTTLSNSESNQTNIKSTLNDEKAKIPSVAMSLSLNLQNQKNNDDVNSNKDMQAEKLSMQDSAKGIIPAGKNLSSSLAELADAELVRTGDNSVSIVISNPRFIQVVRTPKSSDIPADTSNLTLNNKGPSKKGNINEVIVESPISDSNLQKSDVDGDPEVSHEVVYADDVGESSDSYNSPHSSTPKTYLSKKERNKTYFRSRAELGRVTRARRITAKLKGEWAKKLVENKFLMCPMFGCFQKYRTMANFITHYKHCCCGTEKDLKHCPYCDSVIFSSGRTVLQHMKVEHPERLEEYKASYPELQNMDENFEISDDDDSSRLDGISQRDKSVKSPKKRKYLAKENRLSPKKRILKDKIKTMNESVMENSEFKECGHFDKIISRISSVNDKTNTQYADENKVLKGKSRLFVTGHVVAAEKYFEDEQDDETDNETLPLNQKQETEKINTKSRLVLNMDRYKRYSQYLTVTRDWASHRRTYSRPKTSDHALDSSQSVNLQNESNELDVHQLNSSLESSNISLNQSEPFSLSQSVFDSSLSTEIPSLMDSLESDISFINKTPVKNKVKKDLITDSVMNDKIIDVSTEIIVQERMPYNMNQSNIAAKSTSLPKSDVVRKHSMRIAPIITYGKIPDSLRKKSEEKRPPVIDFDSFVKNSVITQKTKITSNEKKVYSPVKPAKHNKEDGIKHPQSKHLVIPEKRKRGRPRKVDLKKNPGVHKKETVKQLHSKADTKTCDESLSGKLRKNRRKIKTSISESENRKIVQNNRAAPFAKGLSKMISKIDSELQRKKRTKLGQARCTLKKAIMFCFKKSTKGGTFKSVSRKKLCVKGWLKNVKRGQQNKGANLSGKVSKASDHNYSTDANMNESKMDENVNSVQNDIEVHVEEVPCISSKEMEDSTLQEEGEEIAVPAQNAGQRSIHSLTADCITEDLQSSSHSDTLKTSDSNVSKPDSNTAHLKSVPPVLDLDKPVDPTSPVKTKRSRGRPKKNSTLKPVETNVLLPKSVDTSPSVSTAVRKSERVKKRKLVEERETTSDTHTVEENTPSQKSISEQPEKTRRRGRPRKHPKTEKNNLSNNTISESQLDISTADSSLKDQSLDSSITQKAPRKGKPRKNLLQKHEKEREKVDGELEKVKYVTEDLGIQEDLPVLSHNCTCIHSQENKKGLILPLKKRKQIGETEQVKSIKNNSCVCSCEESTIERPLKETSKRKVAFEEPISSKVRASIPVLNLQSTISHSGDKYNKNIRPNQRSLKNRFPDSQYSCENIFPEFKPDVNNFKFCSSKYEEHFNTKIHIKIDESPDWIVLKCFESIAHEGSNKATFFVGGPVQSSAFCPTPRNKLVNQYIAVASSHILYNKHSYVNTKSAGGFIQFWNLGCLHESLVLNQVPSLELAIYHTYGLITQMKWCPRGCYDVSSETDGLPRLGLLALSCSDGSVRIYSIPQLNLMPKEHNNGTLPVCGTSPSVILAPLFGEPCSVTRKSMATCIDWHKNGQQIAAGFGNGTICLWMLKTSTITTHNENGLLTIQPYRIFQASGTPVTSISFAPLNNCRWLACSSFDKTLRFFDLYDTCMPFCSVKRGFAFNCEWATDFCGAYVSLHDGILFKGSTFAKECGVEELGAQNVSGTVTSLTYSSISSITNIQAIADMTGSVSLNFVQNIYDQGRGQCDDFAPVIFQTEVVALDIKENHRKVENTCEVASLIHEMGDIVDVIDNIVSYCEAQGSYASVPSDSTLSIRKMSDAKNMEESIKEPHCCNSDAVTLEPVVDLELEEKVNRKLLNDLIESVVLKESSEKYLQEMNKEKESEETFIQATNKEILNYLIESVVKGESEDKSLQARNKRLHNNTKSVIAFNSGKSLQEIKETSKKLLENLVETIVTEESNEKCLRKINEDLLDNLIERVVSKESEEKYLQEVNKELLKNLIESIVSKESEEESLLEESEEKSLQKINKELLNSLIESVATKEMEEKSLFKTNKELLNDLIELVVAAKSEERRVQEISKEVLNSIIEVVVDSEEKSLLETNRELLSDIIKSVIVMNSEEKLEKNDNMVEANVFPIAACLSDDKENLKETVCSVTSKESVSCDTENFHLHTEDIVVNNILEENSFNNHKHLGLDCLLPSESDSEFSDTPQNEATNFSEDSMLSECSYQSDSCQSSHSLSSSSESLVPDVPSESLTALQKELKSILPSSSSSPKAISELNADNTICEPENCSNQPIFEDSTVEQNPVIAKEPEVLVCVPDIQGKSLAENSVLNGEDMDLDQAHSSSLPQASEVQLPTSNDDIECDKTEKEDNQEPISLPCVSTPQTDNELNAPSDNSSVCTQNDSHALGSDCSKEHTSSNSLSESVHPKSSKPFSQTLKTTKITSNSGKLCNLAEKSDSVDENTDENVLDEGTSFATLTTKYGLIFKDALSAGSEPLSNDEKKDSFLVENESNILSAINTISWNPNHGCHSWIFFAGNSGIARLACISELSNTPVSS